MKSMLSLTLAMCLATAALPAHAHAQAPTRAVQPAFLKDAAVREATRLAETLATGRPQQQGTQERNWAGRHPVLLGAVIGVAVGALAGVATCDGRYYEGICAGGTWVMLTAGIGVGIGAGTGAVISAVRGK